jgi:tetratricopeptide (TPR) repeat protein
LIEPELRADSTAPTVARPTRRALFLLSVVLALGTMAVYAPALRNGFVNLDDPEYVTHNAHVLGGLSWADIQWALGSNYPSSNWHPLTWLSHMADVQLYRQNPAGHHFTNVLLHALDVVALFLVVALGTGRALRGAAVAAIFAVQPLNVEAVAWISERKSVLCVLFFLLAIGAYGWYAKKPGVLRYLLVMVLFGLGITAKIMVIAFPFALLLMDYWPLDRLGNDSDSEHRPFSAVLGRLILEKVPLFFMAAAGGAITLYVHRREHALTAAMPLSWRVRNAIFSYLAYLRKTIWPSGLAPYYPHPENSLSWAVVALAALVLLGITVLAWRYRRRKYVLMAWLWYLGTIVPMIGFIQTGRQGMADRFMHIPMMGLLVGLVWLVADIAEEKHWQKEIGIALFLLVAAPYAAVTIKQIGYWHDSYTLFAHTLAVTKNNGFAENDFAVALIERGETQLAAEHFEAAIRYSPDLASAHYNLAVLLQKNNQLDDAEHEYRAALALSSDQTEQEESHNNLGVLYLEEQKYAAATTELDAAIAIDPNAQNSFIGRGTANLQMGNLDAAVTDFARAAQIGPSPMALYWLGQTLERRGEAQGAVQAYTAALKLAPAMSAARTRLQALTGKPN